jgi:hypothetical protein
VAAVLRMLLQDCDDLLISSLAKVLQSTASSKGTPADTQPLEQHIGVT